LIPAPWVSSGQSRGRRGHDPRAVRRAAGDAGAPGTSRHRALNVCGIRPGSEPGAGESTGPRHRARRLRIFCVVVAAASLMDLVAVLAFVARTESNASARPGDVAALALLFGDQSVLGANTERTLHEALRIAGPHTVFPCIGGVRERRRYYGAEE